MAKKKEELPLYTVRVVVQLDPTDRWFWPHQESVANKHHECCVVWSDRIRGWSPKPKACPEGTHDYFVGFGWVVYAHVNEPWKKGRKRVSKKRRPDIRLKLAAHGEIARQLQLSDPLANFLVEGHVTTYYNRGKFWQTVNVFSLKAVSDEQVKSQLSVIAFDRFRQTIKQISQPMAYIPPLEKAFATQIKQRRLARSRGEVSEVPQAILDASEIDPNEE